MKVKFWVDSGANIKSCKERVFDTDSDFGMTSEEWLDLDDYDKNEAVSEWAADQVTMGFEELKED